MARRFARLGRAIVLFAVVLGTLAWASQPAPASASTESSMSASILVRLNDDRVNQGLRPLRSDSRLADLATKRAQWMASTGMLSHDTYGGAVFDAVAMVGVNAWSSAEAVGSTNAAFGSVAAGYIYGIWQASPEHWGFMMSRTFNYIGIGVGHRDATGESFFSLVFAEAPDASAPVARMTSAGRSGRTVSFTWTGHDGHLQTHTAGLRDFDVDYRVDGGPWATIRTHTMLTQLTLANRLAGHTYALRVRDRDARNNLSQWSSARVVHL
jgi:uncharacterized protein YkwD